MLGDGLGEVCADRAASNTPPGACSTTGPFLGDSARSMGFPASAAGVVKSGAVSPMSSAARAGKAMQAMLEHWPEPLHVDLHPSHEDGWAGTFSRGHGDRASPRRRPLAGKAPHACPPAAAPVCGTGTLGGMAWLLANTGLGRLRMLPPLPERARWRIDPGQRARWTHRESRLPDQ
jgi:hypothetical protein